MSSSPIAFAPAGMVDVGVAIDYDDIAGGPAQVEHLSPSGRQEASRCVCSGSSLERPEERRQVHGPCIARLLGLKRQWLRVLKGPSAGLTAGASN